MQDTIAAIATPPGIGALGIIRVSGPNAISDVSKIFPGKDLNTVNSHTLHFGPLQKNGSILDEVLISVFKNPHSYTGEDLVEISCHGSPYILQSVMEVLIEQGIRPANPGEFTLRAFLNGKLDLAQAEAVADLIASESASAHKAAMEQMRGGISRKIKALRAQLLQLASLLELELDFAEEDVEFANRDQLKSLLSEIYREVKQLKDSFQLGNAIKSGVKVVIAGRPNAGKSTLLNALLEEERAIVSDIPGTTRDTIEDTLTIEGIQFRFIDTAGIRASSDVLESAGIERTLAKLQEADLIIYLFDVQEVNNDDLAKDLEKLPKNKAILITGNKIDKSAEHNLKELYPDFSELVFISGKHNFNIELLKKKLIVSLNLPEQRQNDLLVTNIRHYKSFQNILRLIENIERGIENTLPTDLLAADVRAALHEMGELTGEITTDEILGNIFSQFCIGK